MVVSAEDRRKWDRQVAALIEMDNDDEGSLEWRAAAIEAINRRRISNGRAELATEGELHRRARALGLLGRLRAPTR
jgi:hypothetical protein